MARPDSWMPFYISDWMVKTGDLTAEARGAYVELIFAYWRTGRPLPDNDEKLQRLSRCTDKEWQRCRAEVMAFFNLGAGGWQHNRIDEELAKANAKYDAKVKAGQKGSHKRWQKHITAIAEPLAEALATPLTNGCTTHNSHTPYGVTVSKDTVRKTRRTRLANDWKPSEADHAVAIGEGLSPDEIAADLAEWREYWTGPEPRDPLKTDWSRTYRKHVKQFASGIIARRARQGQSKANAGVRQSLTAATDSILAKAGFRQAASDNPLRPDRNTWPEGDNPGAGYSGPILDADHWDGGAWTVERTEGDDKADAGHN